MLGAVAALALLTGVVWWSSTLQTSHRATSIANHPAGLRAAALLATDLGVPTESWRRPLSELQSDVAPGAVLVLTAPLVPRLDNADADALDRWLASGGHVVLQWTGEEAPSAPLGVSTSLDIQVASVSLSPDATLTELTEPRSLRPPDGASEASQDSQDSAQVLTMPRVRGVIRPSLRDTVLYTDDSGTSVRRRRVGAGKAWLFDGPALANRWIARGSDNALVWRKIVGGAPAVVFDDYHQGLVALDVLDAQQPRWPFDLLLVHVALLWMLAAWMLGRPYGPLTGRPRLVRPPPPSIRRELRTLARIHAHHGHAAQAAATLHAEALAAAPTAPLPPLSTPATSAELLELGQHIGQLQADGRLR